MGKSLIIVESPAKARTIEKFLGRKYQVQASMGHVRDLPRSQFGVDVQDGFEPKYITIRGKGKVLEQLRKSARQADRVLLATDPDREGEAISWHLAHVLGLQHDQPIRVAFNEVTKDAVQRAVQEPRPIDDNLVDAQQARRILDRLVGYQLSPLLWRKVRRGLSAGRVQSVAVRLICDREEEIEGFVSEEYWSLTAQLRPAPLDSADGKAQIFEARLQRLHDKKIDIKSQDEMERVLATLDGRIYRVVSVDHKDRRRHPSPPFTTSSLQQEASRKLGFKVQRTMRAAQQLYEGLELKGEGSVGLVTYIRTDSTRVSQGAVEQARAFIQEKWGKKYSSPRVRGKKVQGAQEAHEAIRPTSVLREPDAIKEDLSRDQYRIYKLIWERFVASQMSAAVLEAVSVDIEAGPGLFRATGSTVKFPGFMILYIEGRDDEEEDVLEGLLPELQPGTELGLEALVPKQHFTQPPPRYTEASLVKTLEEQGIGRPSTYAPTIETIQQRGYVEQEDRRLRPTALGRVVNDLLKEHFSHIVDLKFTAQMEEDLDRVEEGQRSWRDLLKEFYGPFAAELAEAEEEIGRVELPAEETDELCEKCGRNLVIKHGRFGRFLACPGFPECRYTKPFVEKLGVACPECGHEMAERQGRKGRRFYGCSAYPECKFVSWNKPLDRSCPQCGAFLVQKRSKKKGAYLQCARTGCTYEEVSATAGARH